MIRMKYPVIDGNPLCDGQVHIIIPTRVSRINRLPLYYVEYYDRKTGTNAYTIMRRTIDGTLTKVPLLDYSTLNNMLSNLNLEEENIELFFSRYMDGADYISSESPINNFIQLLNSISNPSIDDKQTITRTTMMATQSSGGGDNPPNNNSPKLNEPEMEYYLHKDKSSKSKVEPIRIIDLHIDSKLDIYYNQYGKFVKISNAMLSSFMEHYGIVWHIKDVVDIPKDDMINNAIDKYLRNYAEWREELKEFGAYFYTIIYYYGKGNGFGK